MTGGFGFWVLMGKIGSNIFNLNLQHYQKASRGQISQTKRKPIISVIVLCINELCHAKNGALETWQFALELILVTQFFCGYNLTKPYHFAGTT